MTKLTILAAAGLALLAAGGSASAQMTNTLTVPAGKATRVATITALRQDCSIGELAGIRVVQPPKNGTFVVKSGKLKTPASYRCPNVESPVNAIIYQSKSGFSGSDEIQYETKGLDGKMETRTVKINVGSKPAQEKDKGILDL